MHDFWKVGLLHYVWPMAIAMWKLMDGDGDMEQTKVISMFDTWECE